MVSFESDYIAGAHPEVLRKLTETNMENLPGYGADKYCESAREKIKQPARQRDDGPGRRRSPSAGHRRYLLHKMR